MDCYAEVAVPAAAPPAAKGSSLLKSVSAVIGDLDKPWTQLGDLELDPVTAREVDKHRTASPCAPPKLGEDTGVTAESTGGENFKGDACAKTRRACCKDGNLRLHCPVGPICYTQVFEGILQI